MSQTTTPQASSSPNASTGRSLLSRLALPLRSRTRNLADFHIRPFEPYRKYSPGDVVKGIVVLTVVKPIRITHLTVALHGFARVFKTPNAGGEAPPFDPTLTSSNSSRKSQYLGNGHVSLFQDEVVLCGEGRLDAGVYEFEFELDFPKKGVPTSINFERGSISYIIRATLTRPTSITATSTCDRNVSLIETVDIGPMVLPKAHVISLEPISRRIKKPAKPTSPKTNRRTEKETIDLENVSDSPRPTSSPNPEESASQRPSSDHGGIPQTPTAGDIQSETSGESVVSSNTGWSFRLRNVPPSTSTRDSRGGVSNSSATSKTITATIELLKAGCLPGDNIPLRVSIQHTKFIKSVHGIIITLYRQGRIDSAPPLSLFTDVKGKAAQKLKHEEYYPKSKTGFGGLSLSSAGSSHVFRKDLSQVFAPIIIDPTTLSTVVTASIRVPEDVFPTITGVPGQMINFRYHIEVILDLGGKLAGQDKHVPGLGMINSAHLTNNGFPGNNREGGANASIVAAWGGSIVDTDNIRREKSVVACLFEIIVGTTDSTRLRGRGNTTNDIQQNAPPSTLANDQGQEPATQQNDIMGKTVTEPCYPYSGTAQYPADESQTNGEPYDYEYLDSSHELIEQSQHYPPAFVPIPLLEVLTEEGLTEKERIRRAEERLLPSQPPQDDAPSSWQTITPLVPEDPHEDVHGLDNGLVRVLPTTIDAASSMESDRRATSTTPTAPLVPDLEDLTPQGTHNTTEDKQELERRRLMAEASSPADFPDEHDNAGEGSSGTQHEPTAPVLTEEDDYGGDYPGVGGGYEGLPRYER